MEKACGNLLDFQLHFGRLDPVAVASIGLQVLSALSYIHSINVIHRDVSLKNILWFADGKVKLSDFGISKANVSAEEFAKTFIGLKTAIPPELIIAGYSTTQSDIYQLGLVLVTLLAGNHPIPPELSEQETRAMILEGVPRQVADSLVRSSFRSHGVSFR